MSTRPAYVLDSDVFIAAKNAYYAFAICPGFWHGLLRAHKKGKTFSIDKVRSELLVGRKEEDLIQWVKKEVPVGFFLDSSTDDVISAYKEIMLWAQRSPRFLDRAKAEFATVADGWLVAYAMVNGAVVVTHEKPRPDARNRIPLPDICEQFKVPYKDTFQMLRELTLKFDLAGSP